MVSTTRLFSTVFVAALGVGVSSCDEPPEPLAEADPQDRAAPLPPDTAGDRGAASAPKRGFFGWDPTAWFGMAMIEEGRRIFRYDTFGDEAFWGDQLRLHEAIAGEAQGGVGAGVSPAAALALGLKVDVEALPPQLRRKLARGKVDLDDPATTIALLQLDAVVGLTGFFDDAGALTGVGVQCALCHSTVDDDFAPGIGRRLDGWPNRDLNVGAIMAAAPELSGVAAQLDVPESRLREALLAWGPGKFDAFMWLDGQLFTPDGRPGATLIPPLFDLSGVGYMAWNAWGPWGTWMPLIINLEMHGQGVYSDSRLRNAEQFPVAAANGLYSIRSDPDQVTPKLAALQYYNWSLEAPPPPEGFYDAEAAERGRALFEGRARCSGCHVPPLYTLPGYNAVSPQAIGIDSFQADRSPSHAYRPAPLKAMFTRTRGGFFHDGRFATLDDVVAHFDSHFGLGLTAEERADLVEFLKSL